MELEAFRGCPSDSVVPFFYSSCRCSFIAMVYTFLDLILLAWDSKLSISPWRGKFYALGHLLSSFSQMQSAPLGSFKVFYGMGLETQ